MNAKGVIERSVDLVAYQQETGNAIRERDVQIS